MVGVIKQDLTGQTFGRLTVLARAERSSKGRVFWDCKCSCGKSKVIDSRALRTGATQSCGCYQAESTKKRFRDAALDARPGEAGFQALLTSYRGRAKKAGLDFSLSEPQFKQLVTGRCAFCGIGPRRHFTTGKTPLAKEVYKFPYNGIDRVFSNLGYTTENCQTCCCECNIAKNDMEPYEFSEWLRRIFRHQLKNHATFLFGSTSASKVMDKLTTLVEGPMTFSKALLVALAAHGNSEDKGKNPYILHVIRVAMGLETDDEKVPGVLHDTVEDSDFTLKDLEDLGCTRSQVKIVAAVTKTDDYVHEEYLSNIALSPVATEIKILDMEDNCRLDRMKSVPLQEKHMAKFNQYLVDLRRLRGCRRRR